MLAYPVTISPDSVGYLVTRPDLPEVLTDGDTEDEALHRAVDAVMTVLDVRITEREDIPEPSPAVGRAARPHRGSGAGAGRQGRRGNRIRGRMTAAAARQPDYAFAGLARRGRQRHSRRRFGPSTDRHAGRAPSTDRHAGRRAVRSGTRQQGGAP